MPVVMMLRKRDGAIDSEDPSVKRPTHIDLGYSNCPHINCHFYNLPELDVGPIVFCYEHGNGVEGHSEGNRIFRKYAIVSYTRKKEIVIITF